VKRAKAEWAYADNNLHRIEPLLVKKFVTVDQVDQAKTLEAAKAEVRSPWSSRLSTPSR
jgi:multidrug efflux system membrane fusion protein